MRLEIQKLHRDLGATSIFVTHDQVEAMTLANRMIVMNAGSVEQIGAPMEVYDNPASLFVAGFIGSPAMNFVPGTVRDRVLEIGLGQSIPLPDMLRAKVRDGAAITLGVRPEHLACTQTGSMALSVQNVEVLGADSLIHGRFGEAHLVVRVDGHAKPQPGDILHVLPQPDKLYFFDSVGGNRL